MTPTFPAGGALGRIALVGLFVLGASGCTEVVRVERPVPAGVQQVLEGRSVGSDATVLTTGGPFVTRALRFDGGSLTGHDTSGEARDFDVDAVRSIRFRSRGEGFSEGVVVGTGAAVVIGFLTALTTEPDDTLFFDSRLGVALFGTVVTALITVPAGGLIGALRGKTTDYVFDPR